MLFVIKRRIMNYLEEKQERLANSLGVEPVDRRPVILDKPKSKIIRNYIYIIIGVCVVVFNLCFGIVRVSGPSMLPTLHNNDFMLIGKYDKVDRFDIAVLKERLSENGDTKVIVKRVIAFEGERVTVVDGQLFIDNKAYDEYYLSDDNIKNFKETSFEITVPKGHIFVMGDNRDISKDSRTVGSFTTDSVIGVKIN